tara:strand:- start:762 stop:1151 length:390 start_codon:yes stop_codon:yes gene_type:complete
MKKSIKLLPFCVLSLFILLTSCEKEDSKTNENSEICCDNGDGMRMAMQEDGFIEVEINPIEKSDCFFEEWNKTIMTPVSGLFEYYDENNIWVASLNYGDGTCDNLATKTWDINVFPENPEGSLDFSIFE